MKIKTFGSLWDLGTKVWKNKFTDFIQKHMDPSKRYQKVNLGQQLKEQMAKQASATNARKSPSIKK